MMNFGTIRDGIAVAEYYLGMTKLLPDQQNAVLAYHSVGDSNSYGNVSVERFRRDLTYLTNRYEVADLSTALTDPARGQKQIALTFDDGHENFFTKAVPVLREFDLPATVFVVVNAIGDPGDYLNVTATMSEEQLWEVVADDRLTVGNHTMSHPRLSTIDDRSRLRKEIVGARQHLMERLDTQIDRFCYPYGEVSDDGLSVVRDSHEIAVTTVPETIGNETDPHLVPRINAHHRESRVRWELTDLNKFLRNRLQQAQRTVR